MEINTKPRKGGVKHSRPIINIAETKYSVIPYVARRLMGWSTSRQDDDCWDVWWTDGAVSPEKLAKMRPYQKINHFPGMFALARKNHLAKNLKKMSKLFPEEYNFFPKTWMLPGELPDFRSCLKPNSKKVYILKPDALSQGRGIYLVRRPKDIDQTENYVAQEYIRKPYLIDNLKFDLRIYVLLAGCNPLEVYIHEDGLTRLATKEYRVPTKGNMHKMFMHLTNYAINKSNPNFIQPKTEASERVAHKRTLKSTMEHLAACGYDVAAVQRDINDMVIKALCTVQPSLANTYTSCQRDTGNNSM